MTSTRPPLVIPFHSHILSSETRFSTLVVSDKRTDQQTLDIESRQLLYYRHSFPLQPSVTETEIALDGQPAG
jgi:hypothetical protein